MPTIDFGIYSSTLVAVYRFLNAICSELGERESVCFNMTSPIVKITCTACHVRLTQSIVHPPQALVGGRSQTQQHRHRLNPLLVAESCRPRTRRYATQTAHSPLDGDQDHVHRTRPASSPSGSATSRHGHASRQGSSDKMAYAFPTKHNPTPYDVLHLRPGASKEDIKLHCEYRVERWPLSMYSLMTNPCFSVHSVRSVPNLD